MVIKGEVFSHVELRADRVILKNEKYTVVLPMEEVACLGGRVCRDRKCRLYIKEPSLLNCLLNIRQNRQYTLQEIADLHGGISRKAVFCTEKNAKEKFPKLFKKATRQSNLEDIGTWIWKSEIGKRA